MANLSDLRAAAREHAKQLEAVRFLTVQDLAARYGVDDETVRGILRDRLPYLPFGKSGMRRYDPRDVEVYEDRAKRGEFELPAPPTDTRDDKTAA